MRLPSQKQSAFLGGLGAVACAIAAALGTVLNIATGTPLAGGLLNGVIVSMVLTVGIMCVPRPFAATIMWLVFSLAAIPTLTMGPPGIYKVVPGIAGGLTWDIALWIGRWRRAPIIVGGAIGAAVLMLCLFASLQLLGLPGADRLAKVLPYLLPVNALLSALGIGLGIRLWKKRLSSMAAFRFFES